MANRGGGRDGGNDQMDVAPITSSSHHHFSAPSSANLSNDMGNYTLHSIDRKKAQIVQ